eukprot:7923963-Alexandrium_andersonii.AAC.1
MPAILEVEAVASRGSAATPTSRIKWARHNLVAEPRFGPRDLPAFGMIMNSAALLYNADCVFIDLQQSWPCMQAKINAIDDAIDAILTMENEFEIFVHTNLAN